MNSDLRSASLQDTKGNRQGDRSGKEGCRFLLALGLRIEEE